jgi:purine-cytosine permease-like protein
VSIPSQVESFLSIFLVSTASGNKGLRFANRLYPVNVIVLLNLATLTGFTIVSCVIGGQTLSAVNPGGVSVNVGIAITAVIALVICFFGYRVLHRYERYAWIPTLIAIIIAAGTGGKELANQVTPPAASAATVLSFAGLTSGFLISWAALSSDFCTYMSPRTHS